MKVPELIAKKKASKNNDLPEKSIPRNIPKGVVTENINMNFWTE